MHKHRQKSHNGGNDLYYVRVRNYLKWGNTRKRKTNWYFKRKSLIVILENLNKISNSIFIRRHQSAVECIRKRRNFEEFQYQEGCMTTL